MMAFPTARGFLLILMTVGTVGVALVNVGLATALAASIFCSLLAASFLLAQFSLYRIRIERRPNSDGFFGTEVALPLLVTNRTFLFRQPMVITEKCEFAPGGVLHAAVPPLGPGESLLLNRTCIAEKRGCARLLEVKVSGGDPAGLFRRTRKFRLPGEIQIYPARSGSIRCSCRLKATRCRVSTAVRSGNPGTGRSFSESARTGRATRSGLSIGKARRGGSS